MPEVSRSQLLDALDHHLSLADVRKLVFDLHLDWDNLAGSTKHDKIIELIEYCERHAITPTLIQQAEINHPGLFSAEAPAREPYGGAGSAETRLPARRPYLMWSVVLGASAIILVVGLALLTNPPKGQQTGVSVQQTATVSRTVCPAAALPPQDTNAMVYITGTARYLVGDRLAKSARDQRERWVDVHSFRMDRYEVTNAQYQRFIAAHDKRAAPPNWENGQFPVGQDIFPVTNVNWEDASAYCESVGKRLPTEEEWEYACRGMNRRAYPWSGPWNACLANTKESGVNRARPVGSYAFVNDSNGISEAGIADLSGNVMEWTGSQASAGSSDLILRGGSWTFDQQMAACYNSFQAPADYATQATGFRCVSDATTR